MRVLIFGGGSGTHSVVRELVRNGHEVTIAINVLDDGKSTGAIKRAGIGIGVSDIGKNLCAHRKAELEFDFERRVESTGYAVELCKGMGSVEMAVKACHEWGSHLRFGDGGCPVRNMLVVGAMQITGSIHGAIAWLREVLCCAPDVVVVSEDQATLAAVLERSGVRFAVETEADVIGKFPGMDVIDLYFRRHGEPGSRCYQLSPTEEIKIAVAEADVIAIGPGTTESSIAPTFCTLGLVDMMVGKPVVYIANMLRERTGRRSGDVMHHLGMISKAADRSSLRPLRDVLSAVVYDAESDWSLNEECIHERFGAAVFTCRGGDYSAYAAAAIATASSLHVGESVVPSAIILAGGSNKRWDGKGIAEFKQLAKVGGVPTIERIAYAARQAGCRGYVAARRGSSLCSLPYEKVIALNPSQCDAGQFGTASAAFAYLAQRRMSGPVVFLNSDMPFISPETIKQTVDAFLRADGSHYKAAVALCEKRYGIGPVVFACQDRFSSSGRRATLFIKQSVERLPFAGFADAGVFVISASVIRKGMRSMAGEVGLYDVLQGIIDEGFGVVAACVDDAKEACAFNTKEEYYAIPGSDINAE